MMVPVMATAARVAARVAARAADVEGDDCAGDGGGGARETEAPRHSMKKVMCFSPWFSTVHYGTLKKSLSLPRGTL